MARHGDRKRAGASHERWLVSYADLLTLMLALFVVLYAAAKSDNRRLAQMSAAIHSGFQRLSASGDANEGIQDAQDGAAEDVQQPNLVELQRKLNQVLSDEMVRNEVQIRTTPDGITVSLKEIGFFPSGETSLLPAAHKIIAKLGDVSARSNCEIRVEGHTDSRPIHRIAYPSNWELSAARATAIASVLVNESSFDPARLSVAGFAGYRPVASNDTEEGRALNRRVDLVIHSRN